MVIKDIKIIDILQDGRGVGRTDTKIAFIEKAIFGETCHIKVNNEKKNFYEAEKIKTSKKSPYYRKPPCPYYNECGGCSIMDINYETQIDLKKNLIKNAIEKLANIRIDKIELEKSPEFFYRNKIRLKVDRKGRLAYNKKYSNDLVLIKDCLLARDIIRDNLEEIEKLTMDISQKYPESISEISIRTNNKEIMLNLTINNEKANSYIKKNYINSKFHINLITDNSLANISGKDYLLYKIDKNKFKISLNDFYQVNDFMVDKLYKIAKSNLDKDKKILDLFCGSATSSIAINKDHIIGVEINKNAIKDANENAKLNELNDYKFIAKNANFINQKFIKENNVEAVVLDPPRAGLSKEIIKTISKTNIEKVVYISCNPQTLARDINRFQNNGYKMKNIRAVDMFPQTMHVETILLISRIED
ncbi:23S rRNA (uracil(1939)-C(5))-methyltransferase RlmD [Anaerococcus sp. WCA-380-WT-2B]|uniref:23S rRNA (Uracil(1939)-C(5))-methyltransferase RlmD n=1 Tax=Anaerococcus porci TaxID=2652269 RepID=A0A6N7VSU2_9FIRM|nr:23S rRNA (uracil(1939)-C(5))-methyltransferase RlmD [Anaerococcus porci]MSS77143.1 23S rRNA (uracil(1939)-C(5))-methyltransferase RlmD [Anaerococcus porci]